MRGWLSVHLSTAVGPQKFEVSSDLQNGESSNMPFKILSQPKPAKPKTAKGGAAAGMGGGFRV